MTISAEGAPTAVSQGQADMGFSVPVSAVVGLAVAALLLIVLAVRAFRNGSGPKR